MVIEYSSIGRIDFLTHTFPADKTYPPFRCVPASTAGIVGTAGTTLFDLSATRFLSFSSCKIPSRHPGFLVSSSFLPTGPVGLRESQIRKHKKIGGRKPKTPQGKSFNQPTTFFTLANIDACCPAAALQSSPRYGLEMTTASITTILVPSHLVGSVRFKASKISCPSLVTDLFFRAAASCKRATAALARARYKAVGTEESGGWAAAKVLGLEAGADRSSNF